jgi:hypothetical protein
MTSNHRQGLRRASRRVFGPAGAAALLFCAEQRCTPERCLQRLPRRTP